MLEGVAFLELMSDTWEGCNSFMYTHNWWHLALFLIDLDRADEALALFDKRVWGVWKEFCEDQINAVSLLARLELRGVDVGGRWADVASYLKPRLHEHFVPFLDLQYLYGLARAGEQSAVTEMLASLEDRAENAKPFEREAWADCTVPAAHGLAAYAKGDHAEAARLLGQAMPHLSKIGGSIAQRSLFGAIHLDALMKSGWNDAALKILQADDRERPTVPWTKRSLGDLYRRVGRMEQALAAEYQAEQLSRQYATKTDGESDMSDLTQLTAAELSKLYRKGKASPVETMKAVLARTEPDQFRDQRPLPCRYRAGAEGGARVGAALEEGQAAVADRRRAGVDQGAGAGEGLGRPRWAASSPTRRRPMPMRRPWRGCARRAPSCSPRAPARSTATRA